MLAATDHWLGVTAAQPAGSPFRLLPDLLPIALLYHDQPAQLQQRLRAAYASSMPEDEPESEPESQPESEPEGFGLAAVIGQTISLILRERFIALKLIPQVIRDLDLPLHLPLVQELLQVQSWLTQPADLAVVAQGLADSPDLGGMALYSFLSSPDDFQISLLRLHRLIPASSSQADLALAGAILGAVSGLYGGLLGLPAIWQNRQQDALLESAEPGLFRQADLLLASWSGASDASFEQWLQQPHASLTAAPRVIPARSSLN